MSRLTRKLLGHNPKENNNIKDVPETSSSVSNSAPKPRKQSFTGSFFSSSNRSDSDVSIIANDHQSQLSSSIPTGSHPSPLYSSSPSNDSSISLSRKSSTNHSSSLPLLPRFYLSEDQKTHSHHLKSTRRQEKLGSMFRELLGNKKLRDEAVSAVPAILQNNPIGTQGQPGLAVPSDPNQPPTLMAGLVNRIKQGDNSYVPVVPNSNLPTPTTTPPLASFVEKYGRCQEIIGRGTFGIVRVSHKSDPKNGDREVLYAVKEFKKRVHESEKNYNKRLTSEFCISSSLHHANIIHTLDLLKDAKGEFCEVMEFCAGGDLYSLVLSAGHLEYLEADCFFKQIIRGVNYMHEMGVSHRDLKPENILLTSTGVVKITDFGNSECFRMAWESEVHLSNGVCGSAPYIAPEEFTDQDFDARAVDIWSTGVIYMAMRTGRHLWKVAQANEDEFYDRYLHGRKEAAGYEPIESLKRARCRNVIYSILDPVPSRRITGKQILNSEWGREIHVCEAGNRGY